MRDARATVGLGPSSSGSPTVERIRRRRQETEAAIQAHMRACDDELAAIESFVRLLALRTTLDESRDVIAASEVQERLLQVASVEDATRACARPEEP